MKTIFVIWLSLNFIAFALISIRKDRKKIIEDLEMMLFKRFPSWVISLILIVIFMPLSIPYSISNIINGDDSEQDNR